MPMPPTGRARHGAGRPPIRRGRYDRRSGLRVRRGRAPRAPREPSIPQAAAPCRAPRTPGRSAPGSGPRQRRRRAALRRAGCGSAGAITVAVRSPTPASPVKVSSWAPAASAYSTHSRQIVAAAIPAALSPYASAAAAPSEAAFLAAPAISTPTTSSLRSQTSPALSKTSPSWARRFASAGAQHQRRHSGGCLAGVGRAAQRRDRPGADSLADVVARELAERLHQPLGEQEHGRARADPIAERADGGGQRRGRHGKADEIHPGELDVAGAPHGDGLGQARPRAGSEGSRAWRRSPPPSRGSGSRAEHRVLREPAARPSRCPNSPRRSPRPCAAAADRRATPTGARRWARSEP